MKKPDEYAILSSVWILACNDDTSLITYKGIRYRLGLPNDFNLESLIESHGELFRRGMPPSRLDLWKQDMHGGKRRPAFIREETNTEKQLKLIDALQPHDGFRSQFRTELDAPKADVAVIEWGLNHIERLRKAANESRDATAKSWQMWLVFGASLAGVTATIVAALLKK